MYLVIILFYLYQQRNIYIISARFQEYCVCKKHQCQTFRDVYVMCCIHYTYILLSVRSLLPMSFYLVYDFFTQKFSMYLPIILWYYFAIKCSVVYTFNHFIRLDLNSSKKDTYLLEIVIILS